MYKHCTVVRRLLPTHLLIPALLALSLSACLNSSDTNVAQTDTPTTVSPAERPEDVECVGSSVRKQAFFGDLHIHTKLSFDAYFFNSINGPREAYQFAKGENAFYHPAKTRIHPCGKSILAAHWICSRH